MRITKEKAEANRRDVLAAAARRFREKGFDNVAVADLMRDAGLTHGGFYNHFASKAELEALTCAGAFEGARARLGRIAGPPGRAARRGAMNEFVENYLSEKARDAAAPACPMVAFSSDAARRAGEVQAAYAAGLSGYIEDFVTASDSGGRGAPRAARAAAILKLSAMVGALSMARAVASADAGLSDEILHAAAEGLTGSARTRPLPAKRGALRVSGLSPRKRL